MLASRDVRRLRALPPGRAGEEAWSAEGTPAVDGPPAGAARSGAGGGTADATPVG
jgi:hypothetical protein